MQPVMILAHVCGLRSLSETAIHIPSSISVAAFFFLFFFVHIVHKLCAFCAPMAGCMIYYLIDSVLTWRAFQYILCKLD